MVAEVHGEGTPAGKLVLVDDLRGISQARAISVATVNNMRQNLAFAFVYNAVGVPDRVDRSVRAQRLQTRHS